MAQTSEYGQCCELAYEKDLNEMDGNPATVWFFSLFCFFFVNGNREDREKKEERKSYTASKEMKIHTWQRSCQKTSKQAWKHCPRRRCISQRRMGRWFVSPFFKAPRRGDISRNSCYLYIHSLLFQSMINRWKSLVKGGVDLVLLSLSTSPHPTPPFCALPRLLDFKSAPNCSLLWTKSLRAAVWEGLEPACRYCSSFQISIMSLVADVHMCCPCVYPERWTLFSFCSLLLFLLWVWAEQWGQSKDSRLWEEAPHFTYCLICCIYIDEMKPLL